MTFEELSQERTNLLTKLRGPCLPRQEVIDIHEALYRNFKALCNKHPTQLLAVVVEKGCPRWDTVVFEMETMPNPPHEK